MHFGRLLRAAGLPVGPDRVLDALEALRISGIERRDDLYWTLAAVFLDRHDRLALFDEAFRMFWRDPELGVRALRLPPVAGPHSPGEREPQISRRLAQALFREPRAPGRGAARKDHVRREPDLLGARVAADHGFREHDDRRAGRRARRPRPAEAAPAQAPHPPLRAARARRAHRSREPACARACAWAARRYRSSAARSSGARRRWWCCATCRAR